MEQRLSIVTLGVADLAASRAFYARLGWQESGAFPGVAFFQAGGIVFGLYPREALADDAGVPAEGGGFRGVSIAHNVDSPDAVDRTLAEAVEAGATLVKAGEKVFWGGYSGYFADPDGHLWEVAHNPFATLTGDGRFLMTAP